MQRILEVGDVSQEEALEYMRRHNIAPDVAASTFALVGGRMVLLKYATSSLQEGSPLEGMCPYDLDIRILTSPP
jgi:hypothetical protein